MGKTILKFTWLPPREEWDFREVTPAECRVAGNWEYSRDIHRATEGAMTRAEHFSGMKNPPSRALPGPSFYRLPARKLFPQPWLKLTKDQRAGVLESFYRVPAIQVRKLGDFLKRMQWSAGAPLPALAPLLEHAYVLQPAFSLCGVEAVIKELKAWARKEARTYPRAPRAKAAELPFDALKWLAVWRIEDARRHTGVSFDQLRPILTDYRRRNPFPDRYGVFPAYASHGAWSKARADADRCRAKLLNQRDFLLSGLT